MAAIAARTALSPSIFFVAVLSAAMLASSYITIRDLTYALSYAADATIAASAPRRCPRRLSPARSADHSRRLGHPARLPLRYWSTLQDWPGYPQHRRMQSARRSRWGLTRLPDRRPGTLHNRGCQHRVPLREIRRRMLWPAPDH